MRLAAILVPLGVSLAVAGGIMIYAGIKPARAEAPFVVSEVRHPVSREMLVAASLMSANTAPFFRVDDIHGIPVQIGGSGSKPQFLYFILDGCPCSLDAQPLFNRMYQRYKGKVDFIGVINVEKAKALDYAGQATVLHPVVSDADLKIMKAYGARQSTYNLVIRPDGAVQKMWPGYSQSTLHELNAILAKLTKTKETAFDAAYAPAKMASGCYF